MGLDQVAFEYETLEDALAGEKSEEIARWRKHANLQGYMEKVWRKKNPDATQLAFNCEAVVLSLEDLDDLELQITKGTLEHTTGFFFGKSDRYDDELTIDFIRRARDVIERGNVVTYWSWW